MKLYDERGVDSVSVNEICKAAGVAVGTFYYYYATKEDIFLQVNRDAEINLAEMLKDFDSEEDAVSYIEKFFDCYALQNQTMGTNGSARLYYDHYVRNAPNAEPNKVFALLQKKLEDFQSKEQITKEIPAKQITNEMFIGARGLIFEWCVMDGNFDLQKAMRRHMKPYISYYTKNNEI